MSGAVEHCSGSLLPLNKWLYPYESGGDSNGFLTNKVKIYKNIWFPFPFWAHNEICKFNNSRSAASTLTGTWPSWWVWSRCLCWVPMWCYRWMTGEGASCASDRTPEDCNRTSVSPQASLTWLRSSYRESYCPWSIAEIWKRERVDQSCLCPGLWCE